MKELSVFIDESGDFGEYDDQAPYSHSEELFLGKQYELKRNYLRIIQKKEWRQHHKGIGVYPAKELHIQ